MRSFKTFLTEQETKRRTPAQQSMLYIRPSSLPDVSKGYTATPRWSEDYQKKLTQQQRFAGSRSAYKQFNPQQANKPVSNLNLSANDPNWSLGAAAAFLPGAGLLRGGRLLKGLSRANAIRTMPFKQFDKITRLNKLRSASRGLVPGSQQVTGGVVLGAGVNKSLNVYTDEVNKFLASQGYNTGPKTPAGSRKYKRRSDALSTGEVLSATRQAGLSGKEWTSLLGSKEASQGYLIPAAQQAAMTAINPLPTIGTEATPQTSKASYDLRKKIGKGITSTLTRLGLVNEPKGVFDTGGSNEAFSGLEKLEKAWIREIEKKKSRRFKNQPTQTTPTTNDLGLDFSDF